MDRDDTTQDTSLEARLVAVIEPLLAHMGYELVRVAILGRERLTVQVMADRGDGSLVGVEDCERISHAVGAALDVDDPLPGAWTLEVSSAGIDRPLVRVKDWERFAGHSARVELHIPVDGHRRFKGIVLGIAEGASGQEARLRLEDGSEVTIPLSAIRRAKLVLTDALIEATSVSPKAN